MNWLAHTLLSKRNIDYQLGNVLADPLKGVPWSGSSQALVDGMQMHKAIDKFTDGHVLLRTSKNRLGSKGLLKGVVLDLLYDHFLSKEWSNYSAISLDLYLSEFNENALNTLDDFPERPKTIVGRMAETNLLGKYRDMHGFAAALGRIDLRLSERLRSRETASQFLPVIEQNYLALLHDFNEFFPQLVEYFKQHRLGSPDFHYLL